MAGADRATVGSGALRELFAFDKRLEISDGAGNTVADWAEQFQCAARRESLKGGETVMASRLEGRQPYIVTIRYTASSGLVTHDWRARDARSNAEYSIKTAVARPRKDYIDLIIVEGPAS